MKVRILLNLMSIKSGGGQQVASNFINHANKFEEFELYYLVTRDSLMSQKLLNQPANKIILVPRNLFSRFWMVNFELRRFVKNNKIDIIYTLFGPGIAFKNIISVTGCAYSNLFFPEINFWSDYSGIGKLKKKLIDRYRLQSTLKSDFIIFENAAMRERAKSLFGVTYDRSELILPSISNYSKESIRPEFERIIQNFSSSDFHCLFLSGWHPNKNLTIIPDLLFELRKREVSNIKFVITVPGNHPESIKLLERAKKLDVKENILLIDTILPDEIPYLLKNVQAMFLLSKLESFSNNIIEAWHFNIPLFISNEEWSRAICNEAAIFVDRKNPEDIITNLMKFINSDQASKDQYFKRVELELQKYPNSEEKVILQLELLKRIWNEKGN